MLHAAKLGQVGRAVGPDRNPSERLRFPEDRSTVGQGVDNLFPVPSAPEGCPQNADEYTGSDLPDEASGSGLPDPEESFSLTQLLADSSVEFLGKTAAAE